MTSLRRLRIPSILLLALVAALAFAATAAAETFSGEAGGPGGSGTEPESEIVSAKASYDNSTGDVGFTIVTKAEPKEEVEEEPSPLGVIAILFDAPSNCSLAALTGSGPTAPAVETIGEYANRHAASVLITSSGGEPVFLEPVTMTVTGTTTSISETNSRLANYPFDCAAVFIEEGGDLEPLIFPLVAVPAPPAPAAPTPPTPTAAFSLAKIKPLKAKEGKWTKVNVKVTNTGNANIGPIAIKAKAPTGVDLQPASGSLKLPALLAGQSWTVTFRVKLTSKAKKSSTIALTTSSGAISATGSFVLKRAS